MVGPWISDSGAYFAGRFFGRHLLFPSLSPKKTVEGGVGGLLLTVLIVGPVAYLLLDFTPREGPDNRGRRLRLAASAATSSNRP